MAERNVWVGSGGPFLYDDTDTYDDGVAFRGVRAHQIFVDGAPSNANEVVRKGDVPSLTGGADAVIRVITNVNVATGQVKYKDLTFTKGVLTTASAESAWTAAPL